MSKKYTLVIVLLFVYMKSYSQETTIRGFADVKLLSSQIDDGLEFNTKNSKRTNFALGEFDTYISSQLNDNFSFLSEVVYAADGASSALDIERFQIKYSMDNYFNIIVGRQHQAFSYWNSNYHHGSLISPSIDRPMLARFEDMGGFLPIHATGITFSGEKISGLNFGYDVMISNGSDGFDPNMATDNDNNKAIMTNLFLEPIDGLRIGGAYYMDKHIKGSNSLKKDKGSIVSLVDDMNQTFFVTNLNYINGNIEFLSEFVSNTNNINSTKTNTTAFYVFGGYKIDKFVPYVRAEQVKFDQNEKYFNAIDKTTYTLGFRYEINYLCVFKAEFRNWKIGDRYTNEAITQIAIGF